MADNIKKHSEELQNKIPLVVRPFLGTMTKSLFNFMSKSGYKGIFIIAPDTKGDNPDLNFLTEQEIKELALLNQKAKEAEEIKGELERANKRIKFLERRISQMEQNN